MFDILDLPLIGPVITLSSQEMTEVCQGPEEEWKHLIVAGFANHMDQILVLFRMDGCRLYVPFHLFKPSGTSKPDFYKLELIDHGLTIKLGEYESSSAAILYELDPEYKAHCDANRMTE